MTSAINTHETAYITHLGIERHVKKHSSNNSVPMNLILSKRKISHVLYSLTSTAYFPKNIHNLNDTRASKNITERFLKKSIFLELYYGYH